MQVDFAFGKKGLMLSLPRSRDYTLVESRSAGALPDISAALSRALDHPIGSKPLIGMALLSGYDLRARVAVGGEVQIEAIP